MTAGKWWDLQELGPRRWRLVTRDMALEGTLGPPSVPLSLFPSCYDASTLLCLTSTLWYTASSSSPNMGATNRRLRGQLSFKKLQEGREDWNVSQISIQGKREEDTVISCPPIPSEMANLPVWWQWSCCLQACKSSGPVAHGFCWRAVSTRWAPPPGSCLRWWNRNIKDPCHCLRWWHPTLWIVPTLKIPWNVAWHSTETQSQRGISLNKSCPPSPSSSLWGVLITGTPSETLES